MRDRLSEILAKLPQDEQAFIRSMIMPPAKASSRRLRDRLICQLAADFYADLPGARAKAQAIATDLDRLQPLLARGAVAEGQGKRAVLAQIIDANAGRPLSRHRIDQLLRTA